MTITLEIPEALAHRLGPETARMSREALGLEALRQGFWTEAELGCFLNLDSVALDRFLKDHRVEGPQARKRKWPRPTQEQLGALRMAGEKIDAMLAEAGTSEAELVEEFARLRRERKAKNL